MRLTATPNDRKAQQPLDHKIDLTEGEMDQEGLGEGEIDQEGLGEGEIDQEVLGEALADSIQHSRAASPTTDSAEEESDSDETDAVHTRRNTMASTSNPNPDMKGKEAAPPLRSNLLPDQIPQIIGAISGGSGNTKMPKIMEPSTFHGEQDQLRGLLAQLSVYFKGVASEFEYNNDKIVYALGVLRGDALE